MDSENELKILSFVLS